MGFQAKEVQVPLPKSVQSLAHPKMPRNISRIMLRYHTGGKMKSKYSSSTAKVLSLCQSLHPFLPLFGPLSFTILDPMQAQRGLITILMFSLD